MDGLRGYLIRTDRSCSRVDSPAAAEAAASEGTRLLWLDLEGELSSGTGAELARILDWHPLVLHNFREASSRPKLIEFDKYSQITLHALNLAAPREEDPTIEIDLVLSRNCLVTCHRRKVQSIDEAMEDLEAGRYTPGSADEMLYHMVSRMLDKYAPAVEVYGERIARLETEAMHSPSSGLLERIVQARDEILALGLAMAPQQIILSELATGICRHVRPFIRPYFRDAESRLRNLSDELASYKEMLANTLELYRSAMSSRTNETMKVLTAMSALFLPLTFVTGLFGMNVELPLTNQHHAFLIIIVLCLASFIGMTAFFKVRKWF